MFIGFCTVAKEAADPSIWKDVMSAGGALAGFLLGFCAEPIRRTLFRPTLSLRFGNGADLRGVTLHADGGYVFLRGAVSNTSRWFDAKSVRIFLASIERREASGRFVRIDFGDALQFRWSAVPESARDAAKDMPKGLEFCFDIIKTKEGEAAPTLCTAYFPARYRELMAEPGQYRLCIAITSENAKTQYAKAIVDWRGAWQTVEIVTRA